MKVGRKQQVLNRLLEAGGEWVNGSELATEVVGGSEGLKRLREARAEGWPVAERRHPDPRRSIWQYRLPAGTTGPRVAPAPITVADPGPRSDKYGSTRVDPLRPGATKPVRGPMCDSAGCTFELGDIQPSLSPGFVTGKCPKHGRKTVRT